MAASPAAQCDTRFDTQIERVRELRRHHEYAKSSTLIDQVLKEYPDSAIAYGDRGEILLETKQFDAAIKDFTKSIQLDPMFLESVKRRGFCYASLHKYPEAIADYSKIVERHPEDGIAYFDRSVAYERAGNADAAKADKQLALQHGCPNGSLQLLEQVRQMYYSGRFKAANEAASALEQRGCRVADLYAIRGRCRLAEESFDLAAIDFTRALAIHPEDLSLLVLRAGAYLNLEKYDDALADCTRVIEKKPRFLMTRVITPAGRPKKISVLFEAYRERVEAYRALGHFDKALADCIASLHEWSDRVETIEQKADLEKRLKRTQEAVADYLRATKLDSQNTDAWFGLAQAYGDLKQYNNAVDVCNKYISSFPDDDDGYVLRADFYMATGQSAKAISDYSRAIALAQHNASPALRKRAAAFRGIGNNARAAADMKEADRLDSDRPVAPVTVAPVKLHKKP